jgi:hypothetical protein
LAIQNQRVSVDLFNWKRHHAQQQQDAENLLAEHSHLPGAVEPAEIDLPASVHSWILQLGLLNGVPFNYLVPDERLLPSESIRFFQVDPVWVECLLDGAFGVSRVLSSDMEHDQALKEAGKIPARAHQHERLSGFLLRSSVVSGYPHLLVDGYVLAHDEGGTTFHKITADSPLPNELVNIFKTKALFLPANPLLHNTKSNKWKISDPGSKQLLYEVSLEGNQMAIKLPLLRMDRLSSSLLLCIFGGTLERMDIHQKPEALHFGFDPASGNNPGAPAYEKTIRDKEGERISKPAVAVAWRGDKMKRIVDINELQKGMGKSVPFGDDEWSAAQFAMEMLEGVQRVQFLIPASAG